MSNNNSIPGEVWKVVPGFEDYEASNLGRVRSNKFGRIKILKGGSSAGTMPTPYFQLVLCREGKTYTRRVHNLVLAAHVGPKPARRVVRHLNGDSFDNRLENLAYGTYRDNYDDAVRHGTAAIGNKLTWDKVRFIRALVKQGFKQSELGKMFGVSQTNIGYIVRGRIWVEAA